MGRVIEIYDKGEDGALTVELRDLLLLLEPEAFGLRWTILDLQATGDLSRLGWTMLELEAKIRESSLGFELTWGRLNQVAAHIDQAIDMLVVGTRGGNILNLPASIEDIERQCEVTIQAIDTTLWRISAREQHVLDRFLAGFRDVRVLHA